jgi:hypothetical protein
LSPSAVFISASVVERECKSSNERDFLLSTESCGGTRPFPLGFFKSTDMDRETVATMGDVELVGSFIVTIDDVDVWVTDRFERCDGILARRGLNGDFRIDSTCASFGVRGPGVRGLEELSVITSVSVGGFDVRGVDGDRCCNMRGSVSSEIILPLIGDKVWNEGVYGRGLVGSPGLNSGGAGRAVVDTEVGTEV